MVVLETVHMPDDLIRRVQAIGQDAQTAARVEADFAAMARRHGVDAAALRATAPLETLAAETCCAACRELPRCHRFLAGALDRPEEFCPNSGRLVAFVGSA